MNRSFFSRYFALTFMLVVLFGAQPQLVQAFGTSIMGGSYILRGGSMIIGAFTGGGEPEPPAQPVGTYVSKFPVALAQDEQIYGIGHDGTNLRIIAINLNTFDGPVYTYTTSGTYIGSLFYYGDVIGGLGAFFSMVRVGTDLWYLGLDANTFSQALYKLTNANTFTGTSFPVVGSSSGISTAVTWDGSHFWVLNSQLGSVYKYTAAGANTGTSFAFTPVIDTPGGITWDGTHFWITDVIDREVYKFSAAGTYIGESFDTAAAGMTGLVEGTGSITYDGTHFYITDSYTLEVYKFVGP